MSISLLMDLTSLLAALLSALTMWMLSRITPTPVGMMSRRIRLAQILVSGCLLAIVWYGLIWAFILI